MINATSLARDNPPVTIPIIRGNQFPVTLLVPDCIIMGIRVNTTPTLPLKLITIQGITWTKQMVFKVAKLVLLEVIPIHMPNHESATKLAALVIAARRAATTVTNDVGIATPKFM